MEKTDFYKEWYAIHSKEIESLSTDELELYKVVTETTIQRYQAKLDAINDKISQINNNKNKQ